jgi:hypothetical protein
MKSLSLLIPVGRIEKAIFLIRGEKVMVDSDLAELYAVETKALNRAVKRNRKRFPADFMFQLTAKEAATLRCQIGTSKPGSGGRRYLPNVFTEQGVAMLSSVLNSDRAVMVNVEIIRAFVRLRTLVAAHKELTAKLTELERRVTTHDGHIRAIFDAIRELMTPSPSNVKQIGFRPKALKR